MAYTAIDDPSAYFQVKTYAGTDASPQAFTLDGNSDLQPDWVWIKNRGYANKHVLFDSVRGVNKSLTSSSTAAEVDQNSDGGYLSAFNSDGFTLTEGSGSDNDTNDDRYNYVAWNWKAGTSFTNDASSTSVGDLDSAGSVNTTAGFSIITYTGTGSSGPVVAHGLGVVPKMMIFKNIGASSAWTTYHHSVITASGSNKSYLTLNTVDGKRTNGTDTTFLAVNTATFTLGTDEGLNKSSNNYIAYCFAEKQGYSKFGSYTGNVNADGNFVYLGFKPAFVLVKLYGQSGTWWMWDNKRNTANPITQGLSPDTNNAESAPYTAAMDFLSNGFKIREAGSDINRASGLIYMAFAEQPFVTSTGVPATAR